MDETTKLIVFSIVNIFTCMLSGAAGGGGGLIIAPFLVTLGLNPINALATAKFSGFGISAGTSARFFKEKITDRHYVIVFSIFGAIGAIFGSLLLVNLQQHADTIEKLMGYVILVVGVPLLYIRNIGVKSQKRSKPVRILGYLILAPAVLLQAAFGSGIGSLQFIIFMTFFGMSALVASATRRSMQLVVATISLAVFIANGLVDWKFGLVGLVSALVGGYIGANIAIKKGNKFVINIFAVVSVILALGLILR